MNRMDKTVPYRLSIAELENFRILRKKMKTFDSNEDGEEENMAQEIKVENSAREPINKIAGKNTQ